MRLSPSPSVYEDGHVRYVAAAAAERIHTRIPAVAGEPPIMGSARGTSTGRAIIERRAVRIENLDDDPEYEHAYAFGHYKRIFSVPLMREEEPIGRSTSPGTRRVRSPRRFRSPCRRLPIRR